jgi:two-component system, OmpR family, phosphate regulon sensor histidine kinase PhoR
MRVRIHHPLFAGFLAVVGLLLVLVVSLVGSGLRRELIDLSRSGLERELALARALVEAAPAGADPDSLAGAITAHIGHRTTLITLDGRVIGDSDVTPSGLDDVENHATRPEVLEALAGGIGFAERVSVTRDMPFLYGATRTRLGGADAVLRLAAPLDGIRSTLRRSLGAVAVTGLLATLGALVLAYVVSRVLVRPLVVVADRAQGLARGDFSKRVPRSTRVEELDELAQAFNRLADELQARLQELGHERDEMQTLIDCMAEGVIALTDDARILRTNRAARELLRFPEPPGFSPVGSVVRQPELRDLLEESVVRAVQAREVVLGDRHLIVSSRMLDQGGAVTTFLDVTEIRRLEQVRRDFVANASHELKTPLTSMRGFAETLLEADPPEHLKREFLDSIRVNTIRLQRLVDDLLDLSRLESGGWVARREEVDLGRVADRVWDDLSEGAAPPRELDFEVVVEGDGVVVADAQGVEQIFRNLLDNARRFTPDGGRVTVRVAEGGRGRVRVEVEDTGAGIPSRALPRIFERFYRADPSRARDVGGTGLGLAIVRHLVQAMGGEARARSELGRGTTLEFTLPAAAREDDPDGSL